MEQVKIMPGYYRKVIHLCAEDSPNVRKAFAEIARGEQPSHTIITPGVLTYEDYVKRRALWDNVRQCISLDGKFYEGPAQYMYPADWLNRANDIARSLIPSKGIAIGCDPAEGGDSSCWSVVNNKGLIHLTSVKTPNTAIITDITRQLMNTFGVAAENVWFDRGGSGKQHVDRLRGAGYNVKSVAFGEAASEVDKFMTWKRSKGRKVDDYEGKTVYKNRRAEMYGIIRLLIDPINDEGFGIPAEYIELRRQLAPIPLRYGRDGVVYLLPKHKEKADSNEENLTDLLGCSPDEADSLALAVFGLMEAQQPKPFVGAVEVNV